MRRKRRRSRLLLALLLLALLEGALQLAAPLVQRAMLRRDGPPDPQAPLAILCVGDSNTYGLHLPRVYAYPSFLEASLSARYLRPVTVVNRGVPGQNTAQVAAGLLSDLDDLSPDLVLILAGINDTWNTNEEGGGLVGWLGRLRLVRLVRVMAAGVTTARPFEIGTDATGEIVLDRGQGAERVNAGEGHPGARQGAALRDAIWSGLGRAVTACRDFGATPVLMTYAEHQDTFTAVNAAIRDLARKDGVLLVDHEQAFHGHFAERGYDTLMFTDHHPNQLGYRLMASGIVNALAEAGLVPSLVLEGRTGAGEGAPPLFLPEVLDAREGHVVIRGPEGWAWQALVSEAPQEPGEGFDIGAARVPLRPGALLALSRHEPAFSGRFGGSPVSLPLSQAFREQAEGPLALCVLLLRDVPPGDADSSSPAVAGVAGPFPLP